MSRARHFLCGSFKVTHIATPLAQFIFYFWAPRPHCCNPAPVTGRQQQLSQQQPRGPHNLTCPLLQLLPSPCRCNRCEAVASTVQYCHEYISYLNAVDSSSRSLAHLGQIKADERESISLRGMSKPLIKQLLVGIKLSFVVI